MFVKSCYQYNPLFWKAERVVYDPAGLFSSISSVESLTVLFNHHAIQQWKLEPAFIQFWLKQAFRYVVLTVFVHVCVGVEVHFWNASSVSYALADQ